MEHSSSMSEGKSARSIFDDDEDVAENRYECRSSKPATNPRPVEKMCLSPFGEDETPIDGAYGNTGNFSSASLLFDGYEDSEVCKNAIKTNKLRSESKRRDHSSSNARGLQNEKVNRTSDTEKTTDTNDSSVDIFHSMKKGEKLHKNAEKLFDLPSRENSNIKISKARDIFESDEEINNSEIVDRKGEKILHEKKNRIPTSISICAFKSFDSEISFKILVERALRKLPFDLRIVEESISLSALSSECIVGTETKSAAMMVKKELHKFQVESGIQFKIDIQSADSKNIQTSQNPITDLQETLADIKRTIAGTLQAHKVKMKRLQEEMESAESHQFDSDHKKALSEKLNELKLQKSEFTQHFHKVVNTMQQLGSSNGDASGDMAELSKSIGIECNRLRDALPIYARRSKILNEVKSNQVSIIVGETGSGKSTQMAQFFCDAGLGLSRSIVCTQPRRIAAITLAERVALEMTTRVGDLVGYKAGYSSKTGENTKIIFTTDSGLLNECLQDPNLSKYSCIIVDEAHERSIYTDILLGMIKICLNRRSDLKLVITSATIDPDIFIRYFQTGPELRVSGRTFPVDVSFSKDPSDDFENYEKRAVSKAMNIHIEEGPGDILVFLCSPVEIMRCCEEFERKMAGHNNFKCLPLHGQLPHDEQNKVFDKLPDGHRKIVFATNCAETSITIDGIKFVIDTGVAKEVKYDPKRNISQLGVFMISQSSANQRKGRAGRTARGNCYRLYSEEGFNLMDHTNVPEILKVHLGQAVLKLADLGINISNYDFIQAPSAIALKSAVDTLKYLGAIRNETITEKGKWISKFPYDPKLGFLIYEAHKRDLLFDAVVIASVLSTGGDFFYRGFSESEAHVIAKSKNRFSSEYGDAFTWLNIYKMWKNAGDKDEQSKWCQSNGINSKTLNIAQQSIKDVKKMLKRDLNINIVEQFSDNDQAMNELRQILFEAYAASLCNFSSSIKAGYFCLASEIKMFIHPSSVLHSLNLSPEWVIFNEMMKTSKEFMKGVTIIEEDWVHELLRNGKLNIDFDKVQKQKMLCVYHEEFGRTVLKAITGPRFSKIPILEEEMQNSGMPGSVLDISKELCTLDIYSTYALSQSFQQKLDEIKLSACAELKSQQSEFKLISKDSLNFAAVRVVLGNGGCVKSFFLPNQTNRVFIKIKNEAWSMEDVKRKFKVFGEIQSMRPFQKTSAHWGIISYANPAEAIDAVNGTFKDDCNVAEIFTEKERSHGFTTKLTWIRRPIKGKGMAFIKCDPHVVPLLNGQDLHLCGSFTKIQLSMKDMGLVIFNTGTATESQIKEEINNILRKREIINVEFEVSLNREKVPEDSVQRIEAIKHLIISFLSKHIDRKSFELNFLSPKASNIYYTCYINFNSMGQGLEMCQLISSQLRIYFRSVQVETIFQARVIVLQKIKVLCQNKLDDIFAQSVNFDNTTLTWKKLEQNFAINIKSSKLEDLTKIRNLLDQELNGKILNCSKTDGSICCLLTRNGLEFLQKIEREINCHIIPSVEKEKVHLYGSTEIVSKAQDMIDAYVKQLEFCKQESVSLKGYNKPPGLLKLAVTTYGDNLERLADQCQLTSVDINWMNHNVQFIGSDEAICKAVGLLSALEDKVRERNSQRRDAAFPDCIICMCPIEEMESLYRLEVCGHAHCIDCLKSQISYSVDNKAFPLKCEKDGCSSLFVIKDLKFVLSKGWVCERKLTSMALNAFVSGNKETHRFCSSPDCIAIYEVTKETKNFSCPLCLANICTSCGHVSHQGLTCAVAKNLAQEDVSMMAYLATNAERIKKCPGCQWPIEKIEGCNKMHCVHCDTYFCWLCLQTASNEQDCYRHLMRIHGRMI